MSTPSKKLREVMKACGVMPKALATGVHRDVRTINNIACGSSTSRRGRQAIVNFLRAEIWPGVHVTERESTFPIGMQMIGFSPEKIKEALAEFGDSVVAKMDRFEGKEVEVIEVVKPIRVIISFPEQRTEAATLAENFDAQRQAQKKGRADRKEAPAGQAVAKTGDHL